MDTRRAASCVRGDLLSMQLCAGWTEIRGDRAARCVNKAAFGSCATAVARTGPQLVSRTNEATAATARDKLYHSRSFG